MHPRPPHRITLTLWTVPAVLLLAGHAAAQDAAESRSFFRMFFWSDDVPGLMFIWLLVLLSVVSVTLTIRFALQHRRSSIMPEESRREIESLLAQKKYRDAIDYANSDPSFLSQVTSRALTEAPNGFGAMERAVEESGDAETARMLRPIELLNILGNIAPMMGLFGTVYGMIVAFQSLVSSGGQPDPRELAAGISTALVTTLWGLVVAIPALAGYALVRNKVDALTSEAILVAEDLISIFKPSGKKKSGSGRAERPTPKPDA